MTENQNSKSIMDAAIEVHRERSRPGLLEDVYEETRALKFWLFMSDFRALHCKKNLVLSLLRLLAAIHQ